MQFVYEIIGFLVVAGLVIGGLLYFTRTVSFKDLGDDGKDK